MTKNLFIRLIWLSGWLLCTGVLSASGQHLAAAYLETGNSIPDQRVPTRRMTGEARMRLSPRVSVEAGIRLNNQYPSGLGDLKVGASVFLKKGSERWSCENEVVFSDYAPYPMRHPSCHPRRTRASSGRSNQLKTPAGRRWPNGRPCPQAHQKTFL